MLGQEDRRLPGQSLQTALDAGDGGRLRPRPAMARVGALNGVLNVQSAVRNPPPWKKVQQEKGSWESNMDLLVTWSC